MIRSTSDHQESKLSASAENEADVWRLFASPSSDRQFCQAWLALLCRQIAGVSAGVVLMQDANTQTFTPVAVWPEVARDLSFLAPVAERALSEGRGVVHRAEDTSNPHIHVAYPVQVMERMIGAVVLESTACSDAQVQALLRQLHWGIAWLYDLYNRRELASSASNVERVGSVLEILVTALNKGRLQQALFEAANQIALHLSCSRVVIGMIKGGVVRVKSFSNTASFEKNSPTVKLYAAAMEEAHDSLSPIHYLQPTDGTAQFDGSANSAHARLAQEIGTRAVLSVPLKYGAECLAVITLDRNVNTPFSTAEIAWMDTLAGGLAPIIEQKRRAERNHIVHLWHDACALLTRLFGPRHLVWKFCASLITLTVAALFLIHTDYRVSAQTVIEGEVQRAAVAPFDGFIAQSYVRAGDTVRRGQPLAALDDRDLRLEQHKWRSEREQYARKLREAMAQADLASIQVLSAQIQQAEAQLNLVSERIARARITAPFDGVVISGDLSQLLGSPAEQGKELFKLAPLQAYRVILNVDEREIRHIRVGQQGKLMIAGMATEPVPFRVSKVTPVATAKDGANFFRVEASLEQAPPNLRPGMEGVGKISAGERQLWWILTHSFTDWLRLSLWSWMP